MHADALPTQTARDDGWLRPVVLALVVHVLVALVFIAGWLWSPQRSVEPAAGDPSMEPRWTCPPLMRGLHARH